MNHESRDQETIMHPTNQTNKHNNYATLPSLLFLLLLLHTPKTAANQSPTPTPNYLTSHPSSHSLSPLPLHPSIPLPKSQNQSLPCGKGTYTQPCIHSRLHSGVSIPPEPFFCFDIGGSVCKIKKEHENVFNVCGVQGGEDEYEDD